MYSTRHIFEDCNGNVLTVEATEQDCAEICLDDAAGATIVLTPEDVACLVAVLEQIATRQ